MVDATLLPPDLCVVCFHPAHPDAICQSTDDYRPAGVEPMACGCTDYVTEAERGTREVYLDDPGGEA